MAFDVYKLREANAALTAENATLRDEIAKREDTIHQRNVKIAKFQLETSDLWDERRMQDIRIGALTREIDNLWRIIDDLRGRQ